MTDDSSTLPGSLADALQSALAAHNLEVASDHQAALVRYAQQLWEWNTRLNLTRHTDPGRFVARDVVDAWHVAQVLEPGERLLDVGTGGGVPGVLVAILRSDVKVDLCESVAKKAKAVAEIVRGAQLRIPVHHARAEDLLAVRRFDTLIARAVAPLPKMLGWFKPFWGAFDRLLVIKGPAWVAERLQAREEGLMNGLQLRKLAAWPIPNTASESVLLEIRPKD